MRIGSMVCVAAALAIGSSVQAVVVTYPALDQTHSYPAGAGLSNSSGPVALDAAAGVFSHNPNNGGYVPAETRYYGGVFHYTPNNSQDWGGGLTLTLSGAGTESVVVGKPGGRGTWVLIGRSGTVLNSGIAASGDMPFVVKIESYADGWNVVHTSLFLGDGATSASEGTPVGTLELTHGNPLTTATFTSFAEAWANSPSQASVTGTFSSTTWNPVAVPEPATLGILGAVGTLLLGRRRK